MYAKQRNRGTVIAPELGSGRVPLIEAEKHFRFRLGRKTPQAFFWVEWDPLSAAPIPVNTVLVMAERK
jgi:hypothetical protein